MPDLGAAGLAPRESVHFNAEPTELHAHALRRGEGVLAKGGALCVVTTPHSGRSPDEKFVVVEPASRDRVWWRRGNQRLSLEQFARLREDVTRHLNGQELFV